MRTGLRGWGPRLGAVARSEIFAEIEAFFIDDALGHRLAATVVVGRIVEIAVEAYVERAIASGTIVAKADTIFACYDLDRATAMPTLHRKTYSPGEDRGLRIRCLVRPFLAHEASNKNRRVTRGTETIQDHALSCCSALIA